MSTHTPRSHNRDMIMIENLRGRLRGGSALRTVGRPAAKSASLPRRRSSAPDGSPGPLPAELRSGLRRSAAR